MSERECDKGAWFEDRHAAGSHATCPSCTAYQQGREDFRREVASALRDRVRAYESRGDCLVERGTTAELARTVEAGTFPPKETP